MKAEVLHEELKKYCFKSSFLHLICLAFAIALVVTEGEGRTYVTSIVYVTLHSVIVVFYQLIWCKLENILGAFILVVVAFFVEISKIFFVVMFPLIAFVYEKQSTIAWILCVFYSLFAAIISMNNWLSDPIANCSCECSYEGRKKKQEIKLENTESVREVCTQGVLQEYCDP